MSQATRRDRMNRRNFLTAAALAPAIVLSRRSARAQEASVFDIATAWPAASGVGRALSAWGLALTRRTGNAIRPRFYFGSVMGTEQVVVRKLRQGQVAGAVLTAVGAQSFQTPLAALEAPGVCTTYAKLDAVRQGMAASLEASLAGVGMKLLGVSDVGARRIFARQPIVAPADMRGTRMWMPEADVGTWRAVLAAANVASNRQPVAMVVEALQTGHIDAYPATAMDAVRLGWNTRSTHVTALTHGMACEITVIRQEVFDALSGENQRILLESAAETHATMRRAVRRDDEAALATCLRAGAILVDNAPAQAAWDAVFQTARRTLAGGIYTAGVLAQVEQLAAAAP